LKPAIAQTVTLIEAVVRGFGVVAAWVCVILVLLVAGDVFARYFFRTGAVWAQELQWHLMSPIALFGMSYALLCGDQVRVDVLFDRFSPAIQRAIEIFGGVLMIGFGIFLVKVSLPWVEMSYLRNEGSPNPGGLPYRFILKAFIPLGFSLLALQGVAHVLRHAFAIHSKEKQT